MTLTELKAHLNELRVDPAWKQGWIDRRADFNAVLRTIRKLLATAQENLAAGNTEGWAAAVQVILKFCAYENWDALIELPCAEFDPHPDYYESTGKAEWVKFITTCSPMQTFKQAMFVFHERFGFWPAKAWPGMPKAEFDKGRRIKDVPRDRLQPGLPADHSNEPIPE